MNKIVLSLGSILLTVCVLSSCKKTETTVVPSYTVPSTYNFDNVEYSDATATINMWSAFTAYLGKSTSRVLSQDTVNKLWNNTGAAFTSEIVTNLPNTFTTLNNTAFGIASKTDDAGVFKSLSDSMVAVSAYNNAAASEGNPGKISTRLFNYTGLEFNQLVAKGLMGALQLKNIIQNLNKVASDDNSTVIQSKGTAMQHDWDLAFGYSSLPVNYDTAIAYTSTVIDRPLALGGYFKERGSYIKAGGTIFEAFRKGRAAINAKDYNTRDNSIATIKEMLEKTLAAACYDYAGIGMTGADLASRFHALSEGYGFVLALKYRPTNSKLTEANYQALLNIFKTSFYRLDADASHAALKQAQTILTNTYGQLQP